MSFARRSFFSTGERTVPGCWDSRLQGRAGWPFLSQLACCRDLITTVRGFVLVRERREEASHKVERDGLPHCRCADFLKAADTALMQVPVAAFGAGKLRNRWPLLQNRHTPRRPAPDDPGGSTDPATPATRRATEFETAPAASREPAAGRSRPGKTVQFVGWSCL